MADRRVSREDHTFPSDGTECAAWLYRQVDLDSLPVVIMAHLFGGERSWKLPAFAERFAKAGMAVFLFDYRYLGDSGGKPRNLIDPFQQRRDWFAAVEHVRSLSGIDGSRLALWGTSHSGGHVIEVAAVDDDVFAVSALVPFSDGPPTAWPVIKAGGLRYVTDALWSVLRDGSRTLRGKRPYYIPVVQDPGEFAFLNTPGALEDYGRIVPKDTVWKNRCAARIFVTLPLYRPVLRPMRSKLPSSSSRVRRTA